MDNAMIGKIEKARRYAEERNRIQFMHFEVTFDGQNNPHKVSFQKGEWHCDCEFFVTHRTCSHTMALERILEGMIAEPVA
jgi:hypothetical protein